MQYHGLSPTARVKEILDLAVIARLGAAECLRILKLPPARAVASISERLSDVYVDISQNPNRRCWTGRDGTSKCRTTSSRIYSYRRQGLVLPLEQLYWQGHSRSVKIPHDTPQSSIRDLSGEGICLPALGSIIVSLLLSGAFPVVIPRSRAA